MPTSHYRWTPWIPVVLWIGVIMMESSDLGSAAHTGSILFDIWTRLLGRPDLKTFETVHNLLRKTGHFTGYAILSWLIFRALRSTWQSQQEILRRTRDHLWRLRWAILAVAGTAIVAALDEIHQAFNPARTGRWQDVVLDSCGAMTLQLLMFLTIHFRNRDTEPAANT